jgi:hypothetical protein
VERELRALSLAYAESVDARDGDRFADLFTPDGELVVPDRPGGTRPPTVRRGPDQLRRVPGALRRYVRTLHEVGASTYVVDGARASGTVAGCAHHVSRSDGGLIDTAWTIEYRDHYRLVGGTWCFGRRALHVLRTEERPVPAGPFDEDPPGHAAGPPRTLGA